MTQTQTSPQGSAPGVGTRFRGLALSATRAGIVVLDRVAPPLAARWALDLWCTLPDNAGRRRDERPAGGVVSHLRRDAGSPLAVEVWGAGPPVYLAHGWGGWRGQLGAFVTPLVDAGHKVVAFDAPGHGDSAPGSLGKRRGNAAEFAQALVDVIAEHGAAAGVVAHSLGGATAALAVRDGAPVTSLVLIAPSPDFIRMTDVFAAQLGYGDGTKRHFLARLAALAKRPVSDFDMTAGADPGTRSLIVHDRLDKEVPYDDGLRLARAWPSAQFVTTEGLGHQRILQDVEVIDRVCRFIAQPG